MILIDIGNTRIKWAQQQAGEIGAMHAVMHIDQDYAAILLSAWQSLPIPKNIYLASVSSPLIKLQVINVAKRVWPDISLHEINTTNSALGVTNAYPNYKKLGVDRWVSIIAAYHCYRSPVCIVACGTAITLDIVDKQGQHLGGMIMPGLNLMKHALSKGTANLSFCEQEYPQGLANDTEAAIYNGNLSAIKGFIEQGLAADDQSVKLVLTGGDAEFLANALKLQASIDPALVLKGLSLLAKGTVN